MKNLSNTNYNHTEVYNDSKELESDISLDKLDSDMKDLTKSIKLTDNSISISSAQIIKDNYFDSIYSSGVASKQTLVVIWNKPMTKVNEKLDEVYIDLWEPHYPTSIGSENYVVILLDAKIQITWVIYLWSKDKFVDAFQV